MVSDIRSLPSFIELLLSGVPHRPWAMLYQLVSMFSLPPAVEQHQGSRWRRPRGMGMHRLYRFLQLSTADRRLLLHAILLVGAVRLGLWILPFRTLRRLLARTIHAPLAVGAEEQAEADKIAWSVARAARCVPAATCLTQALAAQIMLSRRGFRARVHIGVAKDKNQQFIAHAWIESHGRVILGGSEAGRYTRLLILDGDNL
jgi:hypothetical protein